jgi:hypothetical protein
MHCLIQVIKIVTFIICVSEFHGVNERTMHVYMCGKFKWKLGLIHRNKKDGTAKCMLVKLTS